MKAESEPIYLSSDQAAKAGGTRFAIDIAANGEKPIVAKRPLVWEIVPSAAFLSAVLIVAYSLSKNAAVVVEIAILFLGIISPIALLEKLFAGAGPKKSRRAWWMHFNIYCIATISFLVTGPIFGVTIARAVANLLGFDMGLIDLRPRGISGALGALSAAVVSAFAVDFFYYWYHRSLHAIPFLWQTHKMHHMDPEFDVLTGLRLGWVDSLVQGVMVGIPVALLFRTDDVSILEGGVFAAILLLIFRVTSTLNHSNLPIQYGKLSWLFVSPQTHRIHHSLLPRHFDKNFAALFPIWDILFGTYFAPKKGEFPPTGVAGETEIQSVWEAEIFAFREWWKMSRSWWARRKATEIINSRGSNS